MISWYLIFSDINITKRHSDPMFLAILLNGMLRYLKDRRITKVSVVQQSDQDDSYMTARSNQFSHISTYLSFSDDSASRLTRSAGRSLAGSLSVIQCRNILPQVLHVVSRTPNRHSCACAPSAAHRFYRQQLIRPKCYRLSPVYRQGGDVLRQYDLRRHTV